MNDAHTSSSFTYLEPTAALLAGFIFFEETKEAVESGIVTAPVINNSVDRNLLEGTQVRQGFKVGDLNLMIHYADGSELVDLPKVNRLPNAPRWLLGMTNLHGVLVPVFDLAKYLHIERPPSHKSMLLVLAHGGDAAGVLIDGIPERLRWQSDQIADEILIPDALFGLVSYAVLIGDQLWFDLQSSKVLDALEHAIEVMH